MPEEKTEATPTQTQKNCAACGKPVKKLKRYYMKGKYYCSRKCYKRLKESQTKQKA